jgi:hypothetical protein
MKSLPGSIRLLTLSLSLAVAAPVLAEPGHGGYGGPHWHGGGAYRGGHPGPGGYWNHGWHGGRLGWWWVLGGLWTFYPAPIYPYPSPPMVVVPPPAPAPVVVQQNIPASGQPWYFCEAPRGYYPYVPNCPSGWRTVASAPAGAVR